MGAFLPYNVLMAFTCRNVSPKNWEHARQALVFFFTRKMGFTKGEDLAHETLLAILCRDDFEFEKEGDFLRVCRGFAKNICLAAQRQENRAPTSLEDVTVAAVRSRIQGLRGAEVDVYLGELLRLGRENLSAEEWGLLNPETEPNEPKDSVEQNRERVKRYRARKKLLGLL
jgi:DNA-directed RNA polymerase specialized sigma24 family protein